LSVALYGSGTWTLGKTEERVVNAFETWCWRKMLKIKWTDRRKMLKIKWTDRITNDEFQRAKEERPL
jgi:hypothetical protein